MRYLIFCGAGMGDLILNLPMARAIKKADSCAHITLFLKSDKNRIQVNEQLFRLQNDIDDMEYYNIKEIKRTVQFILRLGPHHFDYGFVCQYTDTEGTSKWPCRIIHFAAKKTLGVELTHRKGVKYDYNIHHIRGKRIVDYSRQLLEGMNMGAFFDADTENFLDRKMINNNYPEIGLPLLHEQAVIALCIGTAAIAGKVNGKLVFNPAKSWPYSYWLQLSEKLREHGFAPVLLGGKKEQQELEGHMGKISAGIWNFAGKCSVAESLAVLCHAKAAVGADTGLMHCAGALGVPSLTLFGCTDPNEYLAYGRKSEYLKANEPCSPCFGTQKAVTCAEVNCMKNLSVERVFAKILEMAGHWENQEGFNDQL